MNHRYIPRVVAALVGLAFHAAAVLHGLACVSPQATDNDCFRVVPWFVAGCVAMGYAALGGYEIGENEWSDDQ